MRVITANVNGIRAATRKGFWQWFAAQDADVLCLQELKAHEAQIPEEAKPDGYHAFYHTAERAGYSGVALYSRHQPDRVHIGFNTEHDGFWQGMNTEGRYVQADFGQLSIISIYIPSGSSADDRQALKMSFLERFLPYLEHLRAQGREIIICGDINIAHQNIDLKNWRGNQKNSGFLPEERSWMTQWLQMGFVDVFRSLYPEKEQYTWWSNRGQARANNVGWRIDYHICSPSVAQTATDVQVYRDASFSDHAPVIADFSFQISDFCD